MTNHQKISAALVTLSGLQLAFHPAVLAPILLTIACVCLYAFTIHIERKEDERIAALEKQIADIKEQVQNLNLARGMGR
jgi:hypothetical protein